MTGIEKGEDQILRFYSKISLIGGGCEKSAQILLKLVDTRPQIDTMHPLVCPIYLVLPVFPHKSYNAAPLVNPGVLGAIEFCAQRPFGDDEPV